MQEPPFGFLSSPSTCPPLAYCRLCLLWHPCRSLGLPGVFCHPSTPPSQIPERMVRSMGFLVIGAGLLQRTRLNDTPSSISLCLHPLVSPPFSPSSSFSASVAMSAPLVGTSASTMSKTAPVKTIATRAFTTTVVVTPISCKSPARCYGTPLRTPSSYSPLQLPASQHLTARAFHLWSQYSLPPFLC